MQKLFLCIIGFGVWSGVYAAAQPKALASLKTVALAFADKTEKAAIDKALQGINAQFASPLAEGNALKKAVTSKTALFLKPVQRLAKVGKPVKVSDAVAKALSIKAGNVPAKDVLTATQQLIKTLEGQLAALNVVLTPEQEVSKVLDSLYFLMRVATGDGKAALVESALSKKTTFGKGAAASKKMLKIADGFVKRGKKAAKTLKASDVRVQLIQAQNDTSAVRAQLADLQSKLQAKQAELDTCSAALKAGDKSVALKEAQAAADALKLKVVDLEKKVAAAPQTPAGAPPSSAAVADNAARIAELELQLQEERNAAQMLKEEMEKQQQELAVKVPEAEPAAGTEPIAVTPATPATQSAPADVTALREEIATLQQKIKDHENCATELSEALAAAKVVQDEYTLAQEEWDRYEEERADFADNMADLIEKVQDAQQQLETIERDLVKK